MFGVQDLGVGSGVLVSLNGFGSGAKKRAAKEGRRLNLCSVFVGGQPEFSAPIGVGIISVERSDLEVKARLKGGAEFAGPISTNFLEWEVVDPCGERWTVLDVVVSALNTDAALADAETGVYVVPTEEFKMVCTDGSEQNFASLEVEFRSKLKFFRRSSHFDSGVAILDGDGVVLAHKDLSVTISSSSLSAADQWEEISADDAKAGLVAELR